MILRRFVLSILLLLTVAAVSSARSGLVNLSSASLRSQPSHAAELETQAVYGTPVEILDDTDDSSDWLHVRLPDGYVAFIPSTSVVLMSEPEMERWRSADRLIVTRPFPGPVIADTLISDRVPGNRVSDLTMGSILEGKFPDDGASFIEVALPDGRRGFASTSDLADFEKWASLPPDVDEVVEIARQLNGIPYLWGGTTEKGLDCSGLSQTCYLIGARVLLPRNASQQARLAQALDPERPDLFEKGDLLFFGDDGRITHVAIHDGGEDTYIHSSGRVFRASFNPGHPLYISRKVIAAVRPLPAAQPLLSNPLYFDR